MQLDPDIMESFNISVEGIKKALIEKQKNLKIIYWDMVWDEFTEITDRLTSETRQKLRQSRSEERRGGKECRSRWSPYDYTKTGVVDRKSVV